MKHVPSLQNSHLLFLVHKPRSGSTFLANVLVQHPEIGLAPESKFIANLWQWTNRGTKRIETEAHVDAVMTVLYSEPKFATWQLSRSTLSEALCKVLPLTIEEASRQILWQYCQREYPGCSVYGIKYGGWYLRNLELMSRLFPDAKFLHIIRDGRAVFASSKRAQHSDTGLPLETDSIESASVWKQVVCDFEKINNTNRAFEIQYERLLQNPKDNLRQVLNFFDVEASEQQVEELLVSDDIEFVKDRYSYLHPHVGKEPHLARIDAWHKDLSPAEVRLFERVSGKTLCRKGYSLVYAPTSLNKFIGLLLYITKKRKIPCVDSYTNSSVE